MWAAIWDRAGLQNRPARFNSSAACDESLRRGTRSGPARVSGGEPSPGPARSLVEVAALDSQSLAPKVFTAARRLASSEERVRLPAGRSNARVADRSEAPAFQAGEAGSIPAACSVFSAGRVGTRAGLISRTPSVRFRPLQLGATSWRCSSKPCPARGEHLDEHRTQHWQLSKWEEGNNLSSNTGAKRAGRPRVARLQVGGRLVG